MISIPLITWFRILRSGPSQFVELLRVLARDVLHAFEPHLSVFAEQIDAKGCIASGVADNHDLSAALPTGLVIQIGDDVRDYKNAAHLRLDEVGPQRLIWGPGAQ